MEKYVLFSNNVGAPSATITEDNELFVKLEEVEEAENVESMQYAHFYERVEDDYDQVTYKYIETTNA